MVVRCYVRVRIPTSKQLYEALTGTNGGLP